MLSITHCRSIASNRRSKSFPPSTKSCTIMSFVSFVMSRSASAVAWLPIAHAALTSFPSARTAAVFSLFRAVGESNSSYTSSLRLDSTASRSDAGAAASSPRASESARRNSSSAGTANVRIALLLAHRHLTSAWKHSDARAMNPGGGASTSACLATSLSAAWVLSVRWPELGIASDCIVASHTSLTVDDSISSPKVAVSADEIPSKPSATSKVPPSFVSSVASPAVSSHLAVGAGFKSAFFTAAAASSAVTSSVK